MPAVAKESRVRECSRYGKRIFFKKAYLISLPNWLRRPPLFYIFCIRPLSKEKESGKERRGIRRCLENMGEVTGEGSKWW